MKKHWLLLFSDYVWVFLDTFMGNILIHATLIVFFQLLEMDYELLDVSVVPLNDGIVHVVDDLNVSSYEESHIAAQVVSKDVIYHMPLLLYDHIIILIKLLINKHDTSDVYIILLLTFLWHLYKNHIFNNGSHITVILLHIACILA